MKEIGRKIKEIRKKKGLSQEELAENSKVNLRTIQRIENNESEPRGKTLLLICETLEINIEDLLDYGKKEDKNYLILFHLSVLLFLVIPLGNIIIPLILWLNKKDKVVNLDSIGKNLINYQISWSILKYGSFISFALLKLLHIPNSEVLMYLYLVLSLLNIVMAIIFAIKTKNGETKELYPKIISFIK